MNVFRAVAVLLSIFGAAARAQSIDGLTVGMKVVFAGEPRPVNALATGQLVPVTLRHGSAGTIARFFKDEFFGVQAIVRWDPQTWSEFDGPLIELVRPGHRAGLVKLTAFDSVVGPDELEPAAGPRPALPRWYECVEPEPESPEEYVLALHPGVDETVFARDLVRGGRASRLPVLDRSVAWPFPAPFTVRLDWRAYSSALRDRRIESIEPVCRGMVSPSEPPEFFRPHPSF